MLNDRFITYFRENCFKDNETELGQFLDAIQKPILRTIRIKPGKEEQVRKNLESDGWILQSTNIDRVFAMDRREDFDPLERRLGFTMDHLVGNFYIQELAAAHPVDILADHTRHLERQKFSQKRNILDEVWEPEWTVSDNTANEESENWIQKTSFSENFLILDMASSPGGKTTQLAEYYPNSFIIANEPTRERLPQLLQNLERMGSSNIGISLYPGQLYRHHSEIFDRILLDAPCSGEGTLFKGTDAVKHWHLKNIKEIARLQTKLLDAALHALKVGGEMIYSTCSLNLIENEWVLDAMYEKYGNSFEVIFQKKFWPHIDGTGGFFVAKIRKLQSLWVKNTRYEDAEIGEKSWKKSEPKVQISNNKELRLFRGNISPWKAQELITLYEHEGKILAVSNDEAGSRIKDSIFLMRYGEQIGIIDHGKFVVSHRAWKYLDMTNTPMYTIPDESSLDRYLRWEPIESTGSDTYILISYDDQVLWLEYRKWDIISNTFSSEWRRK
jgi:16S rRNA C967 or C1407 C5-methylase (RsmB/RsmF family)